MKFLKVFTQNFSLWFCIIQSIQSWGKLILLKDLYLWVYCWLIRLIFRCWWAFDCFCNYITIWVLSDQFTWKINFCIPFWGYFRWSLLHFELQGKYIRFILVSKHIIQIRFLISKIKYSVLNTLIHFFLIFKVSQIKPLHSSLWFKIFKNNILIQRWFI